MRKKDLFGFVDRSVLSALFEAILYEREIYSSSFSKLKHSAKHFRMGQDQSDVHKIYETCNHTFSFYLPGIKTGGNRR